MITQGEMQAASIETGVVIAVHVDTWTVDVATQHSDKPLRKIPWVAPYLHHELGQGIYFVPEVGASCVICVPSDGQASAFVLAFLPPPEGETYQAGRVELDPGDVALTTRGGAYVIARSSGVLQLGCGGTAQRFYLPLTQTIRDLAQQYHMATLGGELRWEADVSEGDTTPTRLVLKAKRKAEETVGVDPVYAVVSCVGGERPSTGAIPNRAKQEMSAAGYAASGSPLVLEVDVRLPGLGGWVLGVDAAGNLWMSGQGRTEVWRGDVMLSIRGSRSVTVEQTDRLQVGRWEVTARDAVHTFTTSVERGSRKEIDAAEVVLGTSLSIPAPAVRGGPDFLDAFRSAYVGVVETPDGVFPVRVLPGPGFGALAALFSTSVRIR